MKLTGNPLVDFGSQCRFLINTQVQPVRIRMVHEVFQDAGRVMAMNTVGVRILVGFCRSLSVANLVDQTGSARSVNSTQSDNGCREGSFE